MYSAKAQQKILSIEIIRFFRTLFKQVLPNVKYPDMIKKIATAQRCNGSIICSKLSACGVCINMTKMAHKNFSISNELFLTVVE